ncbi:flippase-like domain-containing protein [Janibacter sp. CX7]|uniref:lysylphosphatidylglycerol synthase transmembrane domain-containing protein n=1 Tax=Janibacter sp. CX7 TaxID=2963431 RepID=UPI0020CF96D2|nr:lysylphosphatidylglycerol synthase transmembrane domain-containing protein [Janibacter sp. CX7]UTT65417.1 flippase-like domain-containing protein [Janibacter sp. CX7]
MTATTEPADHGPAPATKRTSPFVRGLQVTLGLGLAVAMLWWGLPHFAKTSWSEVWHVLRTVPAWKAALFMGLVVAGLYCYTFLMTGAMQGLSHLRALILNVCGSSVSNLLPGGGAVGLAATYSIAKSWGFSAASVTTMAVVTGVWNVLARVALPIIAVVGLAWGATDLPPAMREAAWAAVLSGTAIVAAFTLAIATDKGARVLGRGIDRLVRLVRRGHGSTVEDGLSGLRARVADTVRTGWLQMTLGMVGFFGLYYVLFLLCTETTGIELPFGQLFAAYAIGRLLTAVGVTPGGLGVTETGTAAALVAWGADPAASMAGVVLFSIFTHFMEIPLGALGWVAWSVMPKASADERAATDA